MKTEEDIQRNKTWRTSDSTQVQLHELMGLLGATCRIMDKITLRDIGDKGQEHP